MVTIKNKIFGYFGSFFKLNDSYKDSYGKGVFERFNECIGQDIDDNIQPLINDLQTNVIEPYACFERYVPFLESEQGYNVNDNTLYMGQGYVLRRAILTHIVKYYQIRTTRRCHQILFKLIGLTANINTALYEQGFDSRLSLDDPDKTFDRSCPSCLHYSIDLTGSITITGTIYNAIFSIILFNKPLGAILDGVTYNGSPITIPLGDFNTDFNNDYLN